MGGIRGEPCETSDASLSLKRISVDSMIRRSMPCVARPRLTRPSLHSSIVLRGSSCLVYLTQKNVGGALSQPGGRSEVSTLNSFKDYSTGICGVSRCIRGMCRHFLGFVLKSGGNVLASEVNVGRSAETLLG